MYNNVFKNIFLVLAGGFLCLSWLNTSYFHPWVTFISDYVAFFSLFFLSLSLVFIVNNKCEIKIPIINLFIILIALIPIFQYQLGLILYFSTAFLSCIYLLAFFLAIVIGYNFYKFDDSILDKIISLYIFVAIYQSLVAILQWLGLSNDIVGIMAIDTSRPYGNFAQPNHLATFLLTGLVGSLYLFEKNKIGLSSICLLSSMLLFSTVLTQSRTALVGFIFLTFYVLFHKKYFSKINYILMGYCNLFFWSLTFLIPKIGNILNQFSGLNLILNRTMEERVKSGHDRIGMWKSYASYIFDQPWSGYGWGQVQISQYFHINEMKTWFISSHNIILDILLWNGVILGFLILFYTVYFLYEIYLRIAVNEFFLIYLILCIFIIHAVFEFPLDYAYFLLPLGVLIGLMQAQATSSLNCIVFSRKYLYFIYAIYLAMLVTVWREYNWIIEENNIAVNAGLSGNVHYIVPENVFFLDQLEDELRLISIPKKTKLKDKDIDRLEHVVAMKSTFFNLLKFSQILIYNGKHEKLRWVLKKMYLLYGFKIEEDKILELKI